MSALNFNLMLPLVQEQFDIIDETKSSKFNKFMINKTSQLFIFLGQEIKNEIEELENEPIEFEIKKFDIMIDALNLTKNLLEKILLISTKKKYDHYKNLNNQTNKVIILIYALENKLTDIEIEHIRSQKNVA